MEGQYEKIERYLAGTLEAAELQAFEAALQSDPELAQEVELHRMAQTFLGNPDEIDFRLNLEDIADSIELSDSSDGSSGDNGAAGGGSGFNWLWITLIVFALALIYILIPKNNSPAPPDDPIRQDSIQNVPDSGQNSTLESIDTNANLEEGQAPTNPPPINDPPPVLTRDPFAVNPRIEALIEAARFSNMHEFADMQVNLIPANEQTNLLIEGQLLSAINPDSVTYQIQVFDNDPGKYPGTPLLQSTLTPRLVEGDQPQAFVVRKAYTILYDTLVDLEPGVYYYQMRLQSEPTPLFVGKFEKAEE